MGRPIRDYHKRLLKKIPFNILTSIPKMQFHTELVDVIVNNYNLDGDYFEFGGKPITLAAEDVALIIGRKRVMLR
ncbi:hypothetical protein QJS04_geneDACA012547 [Acorus gramineus]|uniref:Cytochrome P450 n=1 Tax=Acorus gramineus TaxID=55184 RepID=A0AAV9B5E5_ACOGR|nr:hypothetical protein QJS04_geneDACA012547 [Acorus gramineus]